MKGTVNQMLGFENTSKYGNGFLLGERLTVQPHNTGFRSENQRSNHSRQLTYDRSEMHILTKEDAVYSLACEIDRSGKNLSEMSRHEIGAFLNLTDITRSGVLATASSQLKILQSRSITGVLEDSTVDLKKLMIGHEPVTIYLIIPPAYMKSHLMLFKVWIHVFLRTFMKRKVIPQITKLLLLDEIGQLGEFQLLENLLMIGRGYGIRVHCVLQNLQQLKQNFPQSWETMTGNCGIHQFFGISDFDTAKQLEAVTGIGAQELLKIGKDEQYLVINGLQTKAERINYLKQPLFKGLYDKNNFYAQKVL